MTAKANSTMQTATTARKKEMLRLIAGVHPASAQTTEQRREVAHPGRAPHWGLSELAGRIVELSGQNAAALLTAGVSLVAEAQRQREPACWITVSADTFFPPDVSAWNIDLAALPVIHVADRPPAGRPHSQREPPQNRNPRGGRSSCNVRRDRSGLRVCVKRALRAAELVLRSGAFGLVVMELHHQKALPAPTLSRLQGLALKHGAVLLFLTEKADHAPSLNSLVSLRGVCRHRRCAETRFSFELSLQVRKDKRRGPGWRHGEVCCGPPGLH